MKEYLANRRLDYMDVLRGFGIILMIMGHIGWGDLITLFMHFICRCFSLFRDFSTGKMDVERLNT